MKKKQIPVKAVKILGLMLFMVWAAVASAANVWDYKTGLKVTGHSDILTPDRFSVRLWAAWMPASTSLCLMTPILNPMPIG